MGRGMKAALRAITGGTRRGCFSGRKRMLAIKHIQAFDGMADVIRKLHAEGYECDFC